MLLRETSTHPGFSWPPLFIDLHNRVSRTYDALNEITHISNTHLSQIGLVINTNTNKPNAQGYITQAQ